MNTHELRDDVVVLLVVEEVQLSGSAVFELGVIVELRGEVFTSFLLVVDHPDTFEIKVGLLTKHKHTAETGGGELGVASLHPASHEVSELVMHLALISVLLVLEMPEREGVVEARLQELLLGLGNTKSSHIWLVDEEGLEVVENEVGLDKLVSLLLLLFLLDGSRRLYLRGLDFSLEDGLHSLGSRLDDTTNPHERRKRDDTLEPGSSFTHGFAESLVEHGLEGHDMAVGDNDVSDREGVATEELVVSKSSV